MKHIEIERKQVPQEIGRLGVDQSDTKVVNDLLNLWFGQTKASRILFFFDSRKQVRPSCYLPVFQDFDDIPGYNLMGQEPSKPGTAQKVICLRPTCETDPENRLFLRRAAGEALRESWDESLLISVSNLKAKAMEVNTINLPKVPDLEYLSYLRREIEALQRRFKHMPEFFFENYKNLIRMAEEQEREYDKISGFSMLRTKVHDLALRLPESMNGAFNGSLFKNFVELVESFIRKNRPSLEHSYSTSISGSAFNSAILLVDLVPREEKDVGAVRGAVEQLKATFAATSDLMEPGDPKNKISTFQVATALSAEATEEYLKKAVHLFPKVGDKNELQILCPDKPEPSVIFSAKTETSFRTVHRVLKESLKDDPDLEIEGELGALRAWTGTTPSFYIKTAEGPTRIIAYDSARQAEVSARIGKRVRLSREKNGRSWWLVAWL